MKFKIEIVCDNAAFQDGQLVDELHLILHRVINDLPNDISVENPEFVRRLRDTNGNTVGVVELTEAKPAVELENYTPRLVEFIICRDDHTWDTQVETVPSGKDPIEWIEGDCGNSHVAFIAIVNEDPETFTQENEYILCTKCQATEHAGDAIYLGDNPICIKCYHGMLI